MIDSVILPESKPLIMESFCFLRWLCASTIHLAWRGFKSLNLINIFTSPGAIPFGNWLLTLSTYYILNLFEMNVFTDWFTLISKGWIFLVRFWETIISSRLICVLSRFTLSFSWPLNVSMTIRERCSSR